MSYRIAICLVAFSLVGCNAMTENLVRANHGVQKMVYTSAQRVQGWTEPHRPPEQQVKSVESRYCYKSMGDIVCYEQPQANLSNPLFGYQAGTSGVAPFVMPAQESSMSQPVMAVSQAPIEVAAPPAVLGAPASPMDNKSELSDPLPLMPRK